MGLCFQIRLVRATCSGRKALLGRTELCSTFVASQACWLECYLLLLGHTGGGESTTIERRGSSTCCVFVTRRHGGGCVVRKSWCFLLVTAEGLTVLNALLWCNVIGI